MSNMRVSLKEDEVHCAFCDGYGGHPHNDFVEITPVTVRRCGVCKGEGKYKKDYYHESYSQPRWLRYWGDD